MLLQLAVAACAQVSVVARQLQGRHALVLRAVDELQHLDDLLAERAGLPAGPPLPGELCCFRVRLGRDGLDLLARVAIRSRAQAAGTLGPEVDVVFFRAMGAGAQLVGIGARAWLFDTPPDNVRRGV